METATEELGHIEMLATAVAKNLEGASEDARESAREDPIIDEMMRTGPTSTGALGRVACDACRQ